MLTQKIFLVAMGISMAEGYTPPVVSNREDKGSRSYVNNNPGNLRASEFEIDNVDNFSVFRDPVTGFYALCRQLETYASGKSSHVAPTDTISQMVAKYTALEPGDAFGNYLATVCQFAQISPEDLVSSLIA